MSLLDDDPNTGVFPRKRQAAVKVKASPEQEEALRAQLAKLERWEGSDKTYREMLASAEDRHREASKA